MIDFGKGHLWEQIFTCFGTLVSLEDFFLQRHKGKKKRSFSGSRFFIQQKKNAQNFLVFENRLIRTDFRTFLSFQRSS